MSEYSERVAEDNYAKTTVGAGYAGSKTTLGQANPPRAEEVLAKTLQMIDQQLDSLTNSINMDEDRFYEIKQRLEQNRVALETFREMRKNLAIGINALMPKDVPQAPTTGPYTSRY